MLLVGYGLYVGQELHLVGRGQFLEQGSYLVDMILGKARRKRSHDVTQGSSDELILGDTAPLSLPLYHQPLVVGDCHGDGLHLLGFLALEQVTLVGGDNLRRPHHPRNVPDLRILGGDVRTGLICYPFVSEQGPLAVILD